MFDTSKIVHVDDDAAARLFIKNIFTGHIHSFSSITNFLAECANADIELLLLDLHLAEGLGIDYMASIRRQHPKITVVIVSNDLSKIADALNAGADDFIRKDISEAELQLRLQALYQTKFATKPLPSLLVVGEVMQSIHGRIGKIYDSAVKSVLIQGETGTGKEMVAQMIAAHCRTHTKPFVSVNCAAITPSLLERELFGHAKGAYTGAVFSAKGYLKEADGGWLFLDEIASLSLSAQAALLRALEVGEITPIGEAKATKISIRLASATHEDLAAKVKGGEFRQDLYQRLQETLIVIPPLRERREEIAPLAKHFAQTMEGGPYTLTPEALQLLQDQSWTDGNVRALRNCLRAMTEKRQGKELMPFAIPPWVLAKPSRPKDAQISLEFVIDHHPSFAFLSDQLLVKIIEMYAVQKPQLSMRELAAKLDIPKSSFASKLKKLEGAKLLKPERKH